jgi:alpha-amylase
MSYPLRLLFLVVFSTSVTLSAVAQGAADRPAFPHGVAYSLFVHSFADSDGDGIGDLNGVTERLDYLRDLGVSGIWLLPISPSPSYHKYDVTDYLGIHPDYGTIEDFRRLIAEARERGISIIIDLVVNHTSRHHPWFQQALTVPDGPYREYYVWATPEEVARVGAMREISADSDNRVRWNRIDGSDELFYAYFGGHMPDLNFDNPIVRNTMIDIGRFWLELGVDGFRLDAAKHIFEDHRVQDNHAWWREFRAELEEVKPDVYLVGEVWDRAEVVAPYFQGLSSVFNFDLAGSILRAVASGKADSLAFRLNAIRSMYEGYQPNFLDATFLTNHDQNRVMSVLQGDQASARLAAEILFMLPGTPYVYYGEEIGMLGRKPDRNIREPFLWGGAEASFETSWIEAVHSTASTVAPASVQEGDSASMLNVYRRLIALRNSRAALTKGAYRAVSGYADAMVSYERKKGEEVLLVLHNLGDEVLEVSAEDGRRWSEVVYASNPASTIAGDRLVVAPRSSLVLRK